MRRYGKWGGNPKGHKEDQGCCVAEVGMGDRWPIGRQCARKRGHGPDALYCKQHAAALASGRHVYVPKDCEEAAGPGGEK